MAEPREGNRYIHTPLLRIHTSSLRVHTPFLRGHTLSRQNHSRIRTPLQLLFSCSLFNFFPLSTISLSSGCSSKSLKFWHSRLQWGCFTLRFFQTLKL